MRGLLGILFWLAASAAAALESPVEVSLVSEVSTFVPGQAFTLGLRLVHEKGWHTYWKDPGDAGLPTKIAWKLPLGFKAGSLQWPKPERFTDPTGLSINGYEGEVLLPVEIKPPLGSRGTAALEGDASWLACEKVCIPGQAHLKLALESAPASRLSAEAPLFAAFRVAQGGPAMAEPKAASGLVWMLLLALAGGLILNLMPCVLPALSLKVLAMARQAGAGGSLKMGAAYALGVLLSFWALAVLVLALKSSGSVVGWGFQFQNPYFVMALCLVVFVFALNLFGVFEIVLPGRAIQGLARAASQEGLAGSLFDGAFTTLLATPCTAPFLGTALGFAFSQSGATLFLVFTAAGLGLALPAFALSAYPPALSWVPKPGAWMEKLKQFLGFPLLATAIWLLWVLGSQAGLATAMRVLGFLLAVALAGWLLGSFSSPGSSKARKWEVWGLSWLLVFSGYWFLLKDPGIGALSQGLKWESYSPGKVEELRKTGKTVFVDFTAQWCWTCKINEKVVLENREVVKEFSRRQVALLKADFTSQDAVISKALASFGAAGVPLYVVYSPKASRAPQVLPTLLTASLVEEALDQASQ